MAWTILYLQPLYLMTKLETRCIVYFEKWRKINKGLDSVELELCIRENIPEEVRKDSKKERIWDKTLRFYIANVQKLETWNTITSETNK